MGIAHRRIERLDAAHVAFDVTGGLEHRAQADALAGVVDVGQLDRQAGAAGDVIEAGLPVPGGTAGALGWHHQLQRPVSLHDGLR